MISIMLGDCNMFLDPMNPVGMSHLEASRVPEPIPTRGRAKAVTPAINIKLILDFMRFYPSVDSCDV
jgi:hypothetical protein